MSFDKPTWADVSARGQGTKAYWAQWESLVLLDEVLYRKWETPIGDRVVHLPKKFRGAVAQLSLSGGHLGVNKTLSSGNRYLLIVQDYFTKWVEAYSLPNQEAVTVAKVLLQQFVSRFGVPMAVHSDQGRNFESVSGGSTRPGRHHCIASTV